MASGPGAIGGIPLNALVDLSYFLVQPNKWMFIPRRMFPAMKAIVSATHRVA
ncbi:hypothetical protein [Noviherbaspirillum galbum]|uniref:Uncharacterized protein n=1 Tax=Noviherbaspirillum galbum TaxID=2709383 RepID=A0A6B3SLS2_9BURK|nr:hypothetical protein [Noviherbaspirillum galbum]NEX60315.1 hypothetical protein [Noviherbaspirillum galbum]